MSYSPSRLCISAALAAALPSGAELWWYVRALDRHGSGRVVFTLDDAAEALQMSKPTVYRWFGECRKAGLLDRLAGGDGVYVVSYLSIAKAAVMAGVSDLGACGFIPMAQARSLRYLITDMQAEAHQRASIYAALKADNRFPLVSAAENDLVRPIFENPEHPYLPWSGAKRVAGIKWVGKGTVFVDQRYLLHGSSQEKIAESLGVKTSKTISRRLSNSVRDYKPYGKERGLEQIQRRQIARHAPEVSKTAAMRDISEVAMTEGIEAAEQLSRHFVSGGQVWFSECNLYWITGLDLHPKRHWRGDLKKALNSGVEKRLPLAGR